MLLGAMNADYVQQRRRLRDEKLMSMFLIMLLFTIMAVGGLKIGWDPYIETTLSLLAPTDVRRDYRKASRDGQ